VAPVHLQALGRLDDAGIAERLGTGPVFVSMARYEPFGLAVLEAAQAGCALVLSDIPTFRELWEGAALFVPAEDDASLTEAVNGLLRDGEAQLRLGEAARQRAQTYSLEAMSAGVLAAYRSVLGPWDLAESDYPSRGERAASARSSIPSVEDAA
jgi:glycosyltransferase involved in cell wall biosynthesis